MKKGLGRGLSALIPEYESFEPEKGEKIQVIEIIKIRPNPYQPRRDFDPQKLEELASSLKQYGMLQPVLVTPKEGNYELVAGERRYRAARLAQLEEIPCIVRTLSSREVNEISLIENIQREDLNVLEESMAYQRLIADYEYTQEELAQKLGKSRPHIANTLRLLNLSPYCHNLLLKDELSAGHCRAILSLPNTVAQDALAKKIVGQNLNVRQAESLAQSLKGEVSEKIKKLNPKVRDAFLLSLESKMQQKLGTKVVVQHKKQGGRFMIEFYNDEDLQRLLEFFLPGELF